MGKRTSKEIKVTWVEPDEIREPRHKVRSVAVAAEVSRIDEPVQGFFGADRQRQEPGALPGGDPAELHESGRTGLIGAPTYPMLRDATQAALFEILDSNEIPYEHNKAENTLVMMDTGSKILFRPVDEFERLRGTNLAWFGLDELTYTQEESWLRLEGRLRDPKATRLCGFAVWTPKGYDWVYRSSFRDPVKGYGW